MSRKKSTNNTSTDNTSTEARTPRATLADKIAAWQASQEATENPSELAPAIEALIKTYEDCQERVKSSKGKLRKLLAIDLG